MKDFSKEEIKAFLDQKHDQYNQPDFIATDPIQAPHQFDKKEDIEIAAFITSTIAWGQRKTIIANAGRWLNLMNNEPFDFIMNAKEQDFERLADFKHRTFYGVDCVFFMKSLQNIYKNHGGLQAVFSVNRKTDNPVKQALIYFRDVFFSIPHALRSEKHVSNVAKNSAAKRLNMFLMWMIRRDNRGVHFGLWDTFSPADLYIPLDVHTANISRKLKLLERKQNDWKAVVELTERLREFDPDDPVKYDFALFGLGVFEKF